MPVCSLQLSKRAPHLMDAVSVLAGYQPLEAWTSNDMSRL